MTLSDLEKLSAAIEDRVKWEVKWAQVDLDSPIPGRKRLLTNLHKARRKVTRMIEGEWEAQLIAQQSSSSKNP